MVYANSAPSKFASSVYSLVGLSTFHSTFPFPPTFYLPPLSQNYTLEREGCGPCGHDGSPMWSLGKPTSVVFIFKLPV